MVGGFLPRHGSSAVKSGRLRDNRWRCRRRSCRRCLRHWCDEATGRRLGETGAVESLDRNALADAAAGGFVAPVAAGSVPTALPRNVTQASNLDSR